MSSVATAYVTVVPKFTGFKASVESQLNSISSSGSSAGSKLGSAFSKGASSGLASTGIAVGAFSAITTKAMQTISSHVGDAVSRFDTLNNFPTIMESLGYSAEDAQAQITKMSDRLQTLPTTLDDMVSTVKGISAVTGDIEQATDAGLALNDMLVASGSSTQLTSAAMEQFRQMLSKGKPDMQDWKSLVQAMPGQMNQLAEAMLGTGATANDLYTALGGGGAEATISMDELLNKMIELDTTGGASFASFKDQAETAAGGVSTSMANLGNAVTRGLTGIMDEIGKDTISSAFTNMKGAVNDAFGVIKSGVSAAKPVITTLVDSIEDIAPAVGIAAAAFVTLKTAMNLGSAIASIKPLGAALTGISIAAGIVIPKIMEFVENTENANKATTYLSDAMAGADFNTMATGLSSASEAAKISYKSIDELNEVLADTSEQIQNTNTEAQAQITSLANAQATIEQYAGQSDLSADAMGRLQAALKLVNDEFGLSLTADDVAAGYYQDANGEAQNLCGTLDQLIAKKQQEIQINAYQDNYTAALKAQNEAEEALAGAILNKGQVEQQFTQEYIDNMNEVTGGLGTWADSEENLKAAQEYGAQKAQEYLQEYQDAVSNASGVTDGYAERLGIASEAAVDGASEFVKFANSMDGVASSMLRQKGLSAEFVSDIESMGISVETFQSLNAEQQRQLVESYDGTSISIAESLSNMGISLDEASQKAVDTLTEMKDAIANMDGVTEALEGAGININDFASALSTAGISTEQLNQIGGENLAALASKCNGNMQQMISSIQLFNGTPLYDKDGNVNMNDAQLLDAQGNLYTWNGSTLVDQNGNAIVNDTELIDAQGNLWTWNNSQLKHQGSSATIDTTSLDNGQAKVNNWNNSGDLRSKSGTVTITGIINGAVEAVNKFFGWNAAGGIRLHALGGIRPHADGGIRYHAGGAIATRAVPLDIVGEDGAEAIVPLTNTRYSKPFASLIADLVRERGTSGTSIVINVNDATLNDDAAMQQAALNFMNELARMNRLNRAGA